MRTGAAGRTRHRACANGGAATEPPWPQATSRSATPSSAAARAQVLSAALGGIRVGVVEGVEGVLVLDGDLEAVAGAVVGDRDGHRVLAGVPAEDDAEAVTLPGCQLLALARRAHDDSFRVRDRCRHARPRSQRPGHRAVTVLRQRNRPLERGGFVGVRLGLRLVLLAERNDRVRVLHADPGPEAGLRLEQVAMLRVLARDDLRELLNRNRRREAVSGHDGYHGVAADDEGEQSMALVDDDVVVRNRAAAAGVLSSGAGQPQCRVET